MDKEELISFLERQSNMLLGMTMDLRIPKDTRECLRTSSREIDGVVEKLLNNKD